MPQEKTLTWEELKALGLIWPDAEQEAAAEEEGPGLARRIGAITARLGSGVASSLVGAVPSPITTPSAAAIGGAGETLAQWIEAPDKPFSKKKIAAEAALSAIPFSRIYKYGAPVAQNVLRGAGIGVGSNFLRRGVDNEGNPLPQSGADLAWDVAGGVLGGGAGYLTKIKPGTVPGDELEDLLARVAGESSANTRGGLVKPVIEGIDRPGVTPPSRVTRTSAGRGYGLEPDTVLDPANAARIEAQAPLAPGVSDAQATISRKPFKVNRSVIPGEDVPITDANIVGNIDESIERAAELAKAQRKAHQATQKVENKLVTAERAADIQNAKATTGTDLGKKLSDVEKAHVKHIREEAEQEAKNLNARGEFEKAEATRKAAQTKIDRIMSGEVEVSQEVIKDVAKVETPSGTRTISRTIREAQDEAEEAGGVTTKAPSAPPPPGTKPGTGPVNRFISKEEAEKALAVVNQMGRKGHVEKMDPNGNFYHIVFDAPTVEGAAAKAVDAPVPPPPPPPEAPPAVAAPVTPKPTPPAPPAAAAPNPTITRKVSKPVDTHAEYVATVSKWSDDELAQGFNKFGGNNSGLGRAIKQVQDERAAAKGGTAPKPPEAPPAAPTPAPVQPKPKGPAGPAKVEATPASTQKLQDAKTKFDAKAAELKADFEAKVAKAKADIAKETPTPPTAPTTTPKPGESLMDARKRLDTENKPAVPAKKGAKPKTLPEGTIPFKDKHGRQKYAVKGPNGNYRVYDAKGRYIASESDFSLKAKHGVELPKTAAPDAPAPAAPKAEPPAPAKAPAPVKAAEPPVKPAAPAAKPEPPATPKTPPPGLKPLTELEKWNQLINKYDKKESLDLHVTLKNLRGSNANPDEIRAVETILRRRGETVKAPVVARVEPPKQGGGIIPAKAAAPESPTKAYSMVPQDKGKWGIKDNKSGQIIYTSKNKDDVADKLERIAKEESTPTVGKRDAADDARVAKQAAEGKEKLGGQGPESYPYRGTKMGVEEKAPPIRGPKEPPAPPSMAAAPVKPKPKGPTPPAKAETTPPATPKPESKVTYEDIQAEVRKWDGEELRRNANNKTDIGRAVREEIGERAAGKSKGPQPTVPKAEPEAPKQPKRDSYEKMVENANVPSRAVKVDLEGAKDAPEVQRRVINELEKYAKKVDKAEDSKMVSDKGVVSYGEPLPEPLVLHVPGGPTITVKPDQVKASIQNFEKQGPKPWQGIVDDAPRPTTITVPTGYGQSFGSQTGSAPSVKLPIGPTKGAAPIAKAPAKAVPKKETPKVEAKAEAPAPTKAEVSVAPKPSVDDLRAKSKEAEDLTLKSKDTNYEVGKVSPEELDVLRARVRDAENKYGKLKDRKKAGEDVKAELDAVGEALGRAKHAVKFAEMSPEDQAAYLLSKENKAKVATPEPTSDDLAKMTPEQQSAELTKIVNSLNKKKGKGLGEKGEGINELALHMGAGAAGALIGAAANPDDPITGALIGGAAGVGTTASIKAAINHVNNNPNLPNDVREKSKRLVFDKMKDQYETFGWMFPQYYRASLLSNPGSLVINSMVGPYGSGLMAAMEHTLAGDPRGPKALKEFLSLPFVHKDNFPKEFFSSFDPAKEMIKRSTERTEGMAAVHGPEWFKAMTSAPAWVLTAGDEASRRLLMRSGFSEAEARAITLTSEPFTGWGKGVGRLRGAKGENNKQSLAMHMLMPFWRTNVNQLEQSLLRFPAIGPILGKVWKNTPIFARQELAKQLMSGSMAGTAYMLGSMTPKENSKYALKAVNNFGGQYGTIAGLAFIAGQASRAGKTPAQQAIAVADGAIFQNWPLPTADTLRDILRIGKQIESAKPGHKLDKVRLPYGVVPPFLSSREELSIPRAISGKVTEEERSLAAPFMTGLKPKASSKVLSPGQKAIAERKARIKKAKREE